MHTTGGYLTGVTYTSKYVFDLKEDDVYWCTADIGWITGHSYIVYGPLSNGATTVMYEGSKSIVRYDNGKATYIQTFFLTDAFETITDYYKKKYGPPTEVAKRQIAPFARSRLPNPAMLWRAVSPGDNLITILEIRKYDDVNGGFPDIRRGAVMLYHNWSRPIFPQLSSIELMMAK